MMRILFVFSRSPHAGSDAQEGLDALLMGSAFTECGLLFSGAGVLQLIKEQQTEDLGVKDFARGFAALSDYGVQQVIVRQADLKGYALSDADLCVPVEVIDDDALPGLLNSFDKVMNF